MPTCRSSPARPARLDAAFAARPPSPAPARAPGLSWRGLPGHPPAQSAWHRLLVLEVPSAVTAVLVGILLVTLPLLLGAACLLGGLATLPALGALAALVAPKYPILKIFRPKNHTLNSCWDQSP